MERPQEIDDWDTERIKEMTERGEGTKIEFKGFLRHENRPNKNESKGEWRHMLETEFVAFANAGGGVIIFGVSDSGKPIGVPEPEQGFNGFFNNLLASTDPLLSFHIYPVEWYEDDGTEQYAVVVRVEEVENKPVCTSRASYYTRVNESAQPMNRHQVQTTFMRSERAFNARRDLEIRLERFVQLHWRKYENGDQDAHNIEPPNFSEVQLDELRDTLHRFQRYVDSNTKTDLILSQISATITDLLGLRERYQAYINGNQIAFEYGRREPADSQNDYRTINKQVREDLHDLLDRLKNEINELKSPEESGPLYMYDS